VLLPKSFCLKAVSIKLSSDIIGALVNQFTICTRNVENNNGIRIIYRALCSAADFKEFIKNVMLLKCYYSGTDGFEICLSCMHYKLFTSSEELLLLLLKSPLCPRKKRSMYSCMSVYKPKEYAS